MEKQLAELRLQNRIAAEVRKAVDEAVEVRQRHIEFLRATIEERQQRINILQATTRDQKSRIDILHITNKGLVDERNAALKDAGG